MEYLFELTKQYSPLPQDEVLAVLHAEQIPYTLRDQNDNALVISTNLPSNQLQTLANRLALTNHINHLLFSSPPTLAEIKRSAQHTPLPEPGSVAITHKNRSSTVDSQPIIRTIATHYTKERTVDLEHPDINIRILITDTQAYAGLTKFTINRSKFEQRKVQYRPFFSPITLHPKLARTFVNLSQIKNGQILVDPFCGTGGFLLEAGLIGAQIIGSDIEEKMITGCRQTLNFYGLHQFKLHCADVGHLTQITQDVDAIVTDFPYGKSTTTKGEPLRHLYERSFHQFSQIVKKHALLVIGSHDQEIIPVGKQFFTLLKIYKIRVHKSLTRYFLVYQN